MIMSCAFHVLQKQKPVLCISTHVPVSIHLTEHSSLSNVQWGFQKGKSTVSALLSTTDSWLKQLEVMMLKLYLLPLLSKLQQLKLDPNIISYVHNYLAGRKQCVVVNGVSSEHLQSCQGYPRFNLWPSVVIFVFVQAYLIRK